MSVKTAEPPYVGELIRKEIKERRWTNGVIIKALVDAGIETNDTQFSNKIYGIRRQFTEKELNVINAAMGTKFKL